MKPFPYVLNYNPMTFYMADGVEKIKVLSCKTSYLFAHHKI